jgi:hypothetical protein
MVDLVGQVSSPANRGGMVGAHQASRRHSQLPDRARQVRNIEKDPHRRPQTTSDIYCVSLRLLLLALFRDEAVDQVSACLGDCAELGRWSSIETPLPVELTGYELAWHVAQRM